MIAWSMGCCQRKGRSAKGRTSPATVAPTHPSCRTKGAGVGVPFLCLSPPSIHLIRAVVCRRWMSQDDADGRRRRMLHTSSIFFEEIAGKQATHRARLPICSHQRRSTWILSLLRVSSKTPGREPRFSIYESSGSSGMEICICDKRVKRSSKRFKSRG